MIVKLTIEADSLKIRMLNEIADEESKILAEKAQYVKNKGFDESYYQNLVVGYLGKFKKASKDDIRLLLFDKLPDAMGEKQKENKVRNILYSMRVAGLIERDGTNTRTSKWQLSKKQ